MGGKSRERRERIKAGLEKPIAMTDEQKRILSEFKKNPLGLLIGTGKKDIRNLCDETFGIHTEEEEEEPVS